mmetsp:Transcript_1906/g.2689  ORF Transcript_1906/g.2689 Transcript_1906/m.2689 type:complete len:236 (+) Transcript_1906:600-1307(+)
MVLYTGSPEHLLILVPFIKLVLDIVKHFVPHLSEPRVFASNVTEHLQLMILFQLSLHSIIDWAIRVVRAEHHTRVHHEDTHLLAVWSDLELLREVPARHNPLRRILRQVQQSIFVVVAVMVSTNNIDGQILNVVSGLEQVKHLAEFVISGRFINNRVDVIPHRDESINLIGAHLVGVRAVLQGSVSLDVVHSIEGDVGRSHIPDPSIVTDQEEVFPLLSFNAYRAIEDRRSHVSN